MAAAVGIGVVALAAYARGIYRIPPQTGPDERTAGRWALQLRAVAGQPMVNLLGLFNAAALAVGVGVLAWTPSFLTDRHGADTALAAYLTAGLGAAQIVATPAGAALAGRVGPARAIVTAFTGMAALAAVVPFLPGTTAVFVAIVLAGFFSMLYFSPTLAQIPRFVDTEHVGLANGYVNAEGFLGSLIAPWVFGLILDTGLGYTTGYLFLAGCGLISGLAVPLLSRRMARSTPVPSHMDG